MTSRILLKLISSVNFNLTRFTCCLGLVSTTKLFSNDEEISNSKMILKHDVSHFAPFNQVLWKNFLLSWGYVKFLNSHDFKIMA